MLYWLQQHIVFSSTDIYAIPIDRKSYAVINLHKIANILLLWAILGHQWASHGIQWAAGGLYLAVSDLNLPFSSVALLILMLVLPLGISK